MKLSNRMIRAAAVTLSKGKMYEYGVPEADHIELPGDIDLEQQLPFAIGTIGDFASESVMSALEMVLPRTRTNRDEVLFSAQVLQAYDDSRLAENITFEMRLLASVAFYLGDVPGTSNVHLKKLLSLQMPAEDPLSIAVRVALDKPWAKIGVRVSAPRAQAVLSALREHFQIGGGDAIRAAVRELREWAYTSASAHELLLADILAAVALAKIGNSSWTLLPKYSNLQKDVWQAYLSRPNSIKEMWPSQRMLGNAGLYRGKSGVVQMPTSAGKTRATQLILRAAFLSGRTKLAVVVGPFRALCQEIAYDLKSAFVDDGYRVNQLSDAMQPDYRAEFFGMFDFEFESTPNVIVLTPEKLLYVLRQEPAIIDKLGLIVYDEGHQFDTGARGVTYELLLTSIKRILPATSQTVLISAVIENASEVARWLFKDETLVVKNQWLQTRRLVAFSSLPRGKDGQLRFNVGGNGDLEFFVPRVIVEEELELRPRERKKRSFPTDESGSIALYLALRLVPNGGVAIYARTKASAAKIVRDAATEVFTRGVSLDAPSLSSDAGEVQRFAKLYQANFGEDSYLTKAAALGIFAHHGNTPHGLRLAVEHAMRENRIKLIVCTSTLAQGVNLPIRYLLVTSPMQGRESIRARDFHNLMGRAGRAGMYGEGTVVFTDHRLYDERKRERTRWSAALELLSTDSANPTGSTLLELFEPMKNDMGTRTIARPSPLEIATSLVNDREGIYLRIQNLNATVMDNGFSSESLKKQLDIKKATLEAVESFLMTYRLTLNSEEFVVTARSLAQETLAYSLANAEQQALLEDVFELVAKRIDRLVPDVAVQARFGRTLLGIDTALVIDNWVKENDFDLTFVTTVEVLFDLLWSLFVSLTTEKRLSTTVPDSAVKGLANGWIAGYSYIEMLNSLDEMDATYGSGNRKFSIDAVVEICEQTFGYEFALLLAAVKSSFEAVAVAEKDVEDFNSFADVLQKRLKYGLPSQDSVSYFEAGFAERVVAQKVANAVFWEVANSSAEARKLVNENLEAVREVVDELPSYFETVLKDISTE